MIAEEDMKKTLSAACQNVPRSGFFINAHTHTCSIQRERERKKEKCVLVRERKKEESCSCLSLTGGVGRHALLIASELECREGYLCSGRVGCMAK